MVKQVVPILTLMLLVTGCSMLTKQPIQQLKGNNVICILHEKSRFKAGVIKNISHSLYEKGFEVTTGKRKLSKNYNSGDYLAVVYMVEYWAWHTPWNALRYFKKNNRNNNIIFVITSGDPDVVIKKPFDAVTSASKPDQVERVSREIITKIERIGRK